MLFSVKKRQCHESFFIEQFLLVPKVPYGNLVFGAFSQCYSKEGISVSYNVESQLSGVSHTLIDNYGQTS